MSRIVNRYSFPVYAFPVVLAALFSLAAACDIFCSEPDLKWNDIDVEDAKNKQRLALRPGNSKAITACLDYLDSIASIDPRPTHCDYPLRMEGNLFRSQAEMQAHFAQVLRQSKTRINDMRYYIYNIKKIELSDLGIAGKLVMPKKIDTNDYKDLIRDHESIGVVFFIARWISMPCLYAATKWREFSSISFLSRILLPNIRS